MSCRRPGLIGLLLLLALLLGGCFRGESVRPAPSPRPTATTAPAAHQVQRGETLYGIARRYGLNFRDVARWNGIAAPYTIYPGQKLLLGERSTTRSVTTPRPQRPTGTATGRPSQAQTAPLGTRPAPTSKPVAATAPAAVPSANPAKPTTPASSPPAATPQKPSAGGWRWPTEGKVIRGFVANDPGRQGIKIAGEAGQPVVAARAGQVVYSGAGLVGYGELVIVKHDGGYLTAYGHNKRRLVQEGEQVKAGQAIAELGRSGTDREMLHFEIRVGGKPVDPLPLLPR